MTIILYLLKSFSYVFPIYTNRNPIDETKKIVLKPESNKIEGDWYAVGGDLKNAIKKYDTKNS